MATKPDYDTCKKCTHTLNIHTEHNEVGACRAHECDCPKFERK